MSKEVKHHTKPHAEQKHEPSKFSLFKHKIANVFKEIVEAPPVVVEKQEPVQEDVHIVQKDESKSVIEEEEIDEDDLQAQEREKTRDMIHEYITSNLNDAVSKWKETGDVGLHLEPPVPLREKVKSFWSKLKEKSSPIAAKLRGQIEDVAEKVSARMKKAEHTGQKIDSDVIVKEEWNRVLEKMESISSPSEREEIEKIYKELAGE